MSCQKCKSKRIVNINGKVSFLSDMFGMSYDGDQFDGYVPTNLFFGSGGYGDYFNIDFCADCGQIQAKFPIAESKLKTAIKDMENG